jgi:SAM-dependent methyltransferase
LFDGLVGCDMIRDDRADTSYPQAPDAPRWQASLLPHQTIDDRLSIRDSRHPVSVAYELARCAVCGGANARELASRDDVRTEVEALWAFHSARLRLRTPTEHLMDRVAFSQHAPLRVIQCRECGLVYRNPVERVTELTAAYTDSSPTTERMQALHDTQRASYAAQAGRLAETFGRRGSGIEVGSYVGAFLAAARERGWQFAGVDVNACANSFTRSLGFRVHDGTLESLDDDRQVDVVAIWNCLDQLPDPMATLRAARDRLALNGMLALRVPNGACYAAVRPLLTTPLGPIAREWLAQNNLLGFPYRFGFTPSSLARALARLGFTVERVVGDVLVPTSDEWTRPWARLEERVVKRAGVLVARAHLRDRVLAPWVEVYARISDR